jgi:hypothetical protein
MCMYPGVIAQTAFKHRTLNTVAGSCAQLSLFVQRVRQDTLQILVTKKQGAL